MISNLRATMTAPASVGLLQSRTNRKRTRCIPSSCGKAKPLDSPSAPKSLSCLITGWTGVTSRREQRPRREALKEHLLEELRDQRMFFW